MRLTHSLPRLASPCLTHGQRSSMDMNQVVLQRRFTSVAAVCLARIASSGDVDKCRKQEGPGVLFIVVRRNNFRCTINHTYVHRSILRCCATHTPRPRHKRFKGAASD